MIMLLLKNKGVAAYRLQFRKCPNSARNGAGCSVLQPLGRRYKITCPRG